MSRRNLLRLGLALAVLGAGFALTATVLHYATHHEIRWQSLGGAGLCCFIAGNAWSQLRRLPE